MKGAAQVRQGWKHYRQKQYVDADACFAKAVEASPQLAFGHLQQGMFWLRQDRFEEAVTTLRTAAQLEQTNPAPAFFLTLALEQSGAHEAADEAFAQLKSLSPRHQGLTSLQLLRELRRGDPLPILTALGFGLPPGHKSSREGWHSLAAGLGVGDPDWLPPDLSSSNYLMGPILLEIERRLLSREFPKLERRVGELIPELEELKPPKRSFSEELRALKTSCASGAKLRKGKKLLTKAIVADDDENPKGLARQAISLLRLGRRLDPFAFRTDYHLGEAYLVLAKDKPGKPYLRFPLLQAEGAFLRSIQMDGVNPYVLFCLAFVSHALGRPVSAIEAYTKATERFTKLPEAHYGSGQCHLLLGEKSRARDLLLEAVNSDLALGRERLNLFATLLREEGPEAFPGSLPTLPPEPEPEADSAEPEDPQAPKSETEEVVSEPESSEPPLSDSAE